MAFAASRAERQLPVVENSGGGYDLTRYIRKESHRVPGYTGHVPGRKIEEAGIGRTYGTATSALLNPGANVDPSSFSQPANPTDFRQTMNKSIGQYVRPGDNPDDVYGSITGNTLEQGAEHVDYKRRVIKTIPGYQGHLPEVRDRIGGSGDQYWCVEKNAGMTAAERMDRTEYRDTTGDLPNKYDKPWLANAKPKGPSETIDKAWRPQLASGGQDPWQPGAVDNRKGMSHAELAMGPRMPTAQNEFPKRDFSFKPPQSVQFGRRAGDTTHATGEISEAEADAARIQHMAYNATSHSHPGNTVTSLVTTGGTKLGA